MPDQSILAYFFNANLVVQIVVAILLIASVLSWAVIFQKWFYISKTKMALRRFEKKFWQTTDLADLFIKLNKKSHKNAGLAALFHNGYQAYQQLQSTSSIAANVVLENVQRAMRASFVYEEEGLTARLSILATIGSLSPYVGLFGTVWGIMMSFHALGAAAQVTIAMVAPGISSALIATAMGLFAAIPAVFFYNRYVSQADQILNRYEAFQEQFISLLQCRLVPEINIPVAEETEETYA